MLAGGDRKDTHRGKENQGEQGRGHQTITTATKVVTACKGAPPYLPANGETLHEGQGEPDEDHCRLWMKTLRIAFPRQAGILEHKLGKWTDKRRKEWKNSKEQANASV